MHGVEKAHLTVIDLCVLYLRVLCVRAVRSVTAPRLTCSVIKMRRCPGRRTAAATASSDCGDSHGVQQSAEPSVVSIMHAGEVGANVRNVGLLGWQWQARLPFFAFV